MKLTKSQSTKIRSRIEQLFVKTESNVDRFILTEASEIIAMKVGRAAEFLADDTGDSEFRIYMHEVLDEAMDDFTDELRRAIK